MTTDQTDWPLFAQHFIDHEKGIFHPDTNCFYCIVKFKGWEVALDDFPIEDKPKLKKLLTEPGVFNE